MALLRTQNGYYQIPQHVRPPHPVMPKATEVFLPATGLVIDCAAESPLPPSYVTGVHSHDPSMGQWPWDPSRIELWHAGSGSPASIYQNIQERRAQGPAMNYCVLMFLLSHPELVRLPEGFGSLRINFVGTVFNDEDNDRFIASLVITGPGLVREHIGGEAKGIWREYPIAFLKT